jgi:hypothetical protein
MTKVFEELAYRHYKSREWTQMIRTKFRLRLSEAELGDNIKTLFNTHPEIGKDIFRLDRSKLIRKLIDTDFSLPLTGNNLVYLSNFHFIKDSHIEALTPRLVLNEMNSESAHKRN